MADALSDPHVTHEIRNIWMSYWTQADKSLGQKLASSQREATKQLKVIPEPDDYGIQRASMEYIYTISTVAKMFNSLVSVIYCNNIKQTSILCNTEGLIFL